jgi:hypothetical protein
MTIEEDVGHLGRSALRSVFADDKGLAGRPAKLGRKTHTLKQALQPKGGLAAVFIVRGVRRDRRKTQQVEEALQTLGDLLINLAQDLVKMGQNHTMGKPGLNRCYCLMALGLTARTAG